MIYTQTKSPSGDLYDMIWYVEIINNQVNRLALINTIKNIYKITLLEAKGIVDNKVIISEVSYQQSYNLVKMLEEIGAEVVIKKLESETLS